MQNKSLIILFLLCLLPAGKAQTPPAVRQFLSRQSMKGASFSLMAKEVNSGDILYAYEADRKMTPASVLKIVTTATALELLGAEYRFATTLEYDGVIADSILRGNLYIKGSGDPSLGSSHFAPDRSNYTPDRNTFIPQWIAALEKQGVRRISGSVIADERIFDTEGVSMKWVYEDLGSYYGAACYGLSVFDNLYKLYVNTGAPGSKPEIVSCVPAIPSLRFHNYLTVGAVATDSSYIVGAPFSNDRYLYGVLPANGKRILLRGDIPDPPLFLAQYLSACLQQAGIRIEGKATCFRLLQEADRLPGGGERKVLATTYSPTLREIIRITNGRSHNLYADALLKTLGATKYKPAPGEVISSAGKGIQVVCSYWREKGLDTSSLWMSDGNGLAVANKVTASFICELLIYMATKSRQGDAAFIASLPRAGLEGTVAGLLKGSVLQGKALLKSGGISRIRTYAGYITKGDKRYAVALFTHNYSCTMQEITKEIETLLLALF
ncbi:MAG: D-alanyl-D-alanine carboxypeptidase/D-alanyl-D-alanine-endopeptidase [Tannerellaceae bacterium]|jgi:D-alanyl-D-alanine carboxypeptidase/D-alanyl-D-alanine-endopeptidase (penicillin-binding protein 4)|nr:D-alanyl-D-alanine carboxypeptidase/D-alanyl-D-alanine-endopeptidase [Tannerellaceae bacterium]